MTGTLHEGLCTFMIVYRRSLLRVRSVTDKSCRENQNTHFVCSSFIRKCGVYEITWKNFAEPDRAQ